MGYGKSRYVDVFLFFFYTHKSPSYNPHLALYQVADTSNPGPWGSFLLIFALKGRDLAVFGAVLTLAAMAVDPFVQQVVQYYSCPQMINGEIASIPYSNNYTDGAMGRPTGSPSLDSQMQSALFVGLLDPPANVSAGLAYTCRTGNCTFPATEDGATFMSLSMGSTCRDITDNISYALNTSRYSNGNNETYTFQTASLLDYDITIDNETAYVMYSGYQYSEGWPSSWLTKAAFLMGPNPESGADKWSATAFECEFYPTVSTWASNITNSVLVEHVVETVRMDVWAVPFGTHSLYNAHRTIRNGTWHTCENTTSPSAENDMPVVWWPDAPGPTVGSYLPLDALTNRSSEISTAANYTSWWPSDCVYSLPYVPTAGLAATIRGLVGNESLYWDAWTSRPQGDLWMVSLWNNGSATSDTVQLAMDGLSHSVTARLRTGDAGVSVRAADGLVQGSVWEQQTCVRARWLWLTLPAAMVALTTAFLVLTAVRTSLAFRRGGENSGARALVWKSSPLAVLFNGLDEGTREATGPVTSLRDMQAAAEQTRMQLKETPNGYRLVGTRL